MPTFTDEDIMDQIDIRNFGTLVTLRTSRWHAKIKDRKASKDAADAVGADQRAFESHKHLLAGADEKLKRVHSAIDAARSAHYSMTLPWSVVGINEQGKRQGSRLLPNTLFMEYTTAVAKAKQETEDALNDFEQHYPQLQQIAQKNLGSAFNPGDYPPAATIRAHFGLDFEFAPIPKGSDFDALQGQQAQKLSQALNSRTRNMLENAMQDAWKRLYETVQHAYVKLADPDKVFHYTLVEKLRDQASMLKHLNVTGDERIEQIRNRIEKQLTTYDVKDIRKDDALRKQLAEVAGEVFQSMKEFADETQ
jgi:chorismate mutase